MTTNEQELREKVNVILTKVHDDAVSKFHDPTLSYSNRATDQLLALIRSETNKVLERVLGRVWQACRDEFIKAIKEITNE